MGWEYGINIDGREIGYSVEGTCDQQDCNKQIDRGLSYVCGGMHDGGYLGCGKYFCSDHLYITEDQLCNACNDEFMKENPNFWEQFEND